MKSNVRLIVIGCFPLLVALQSAMLEAKDVDSSEQGSETLADLYLKGRSHFHLKEYAEAAEAFRRVIELSPRHEYHLDVGECEYLRGRFDLAMEEFEIFREGAGKNMADDARALVDKVFKEGALKVGYLNFTETESFEVWIDGEHRGNTPLSKPIIVMSGKHDIVFKQNGQPVSDTKVTLLSGATIDIVRPEPQPEPQSEATPLEQPQKDENDLNTQTPVDEGILAPKPKKLSPLKIAGFATVGLGGALLVASAITGKMANSKADRLDDKCSLVNQPCDTKYEDINTKGESLKKANIALFIAGTAATVTGVVLAVVGIKRSRSGEKITLKTSPVVGANTAGWVVEGRF
ncbi:MAG: tetratricopeptide repeat protein [Deltaproteobacteria bacterium]|nr:tetratricopeptide repeat protein [Deltaproteobacteria bacterium]